MMLGLIAIVALQAAAPTPAQMEAEARKALTARGVSSAGIDASIAVERRHQAAVTAIIDRGRAAQTAIQAALAKRPVDVDAFARAMTARADAAAGLQREAASVSIDQMRALSPADRVVVARSGAAASPPPAAKR